MTFKGAADGEIAFGALKGFLDVRYGARDGSACAVFQLWLAPPPFESPERFAWRYRVRASRRALRCARERERERERESSSKIDRLFGRAVRAAVVVYGTTLAVIVVLTKAFGLRRAQAAKAHGAAAG